LSDGTRHKTSAVKTSYVTVLCSVRGVSPPKFDITIKVQFISVSTHRAPPMSVESHYRRRPIGEGLVAFNVGSLDMMQLKN